MTQIVIEGDLAERLLALAAQQDQPVNEFLDDLLTKWGDRNDVPTVSRDDPRRGSLEDLIGIIDSDMTDMSIAVSETMREIFSEKHPQNQP